MGAAYSLLKASVALTVVPALTALASFVILAIFSAQLVAQVRAQAPASSERLASVLAVLIAAWALLYIPGVNLILAIVVAVLVKAHAAGDESESGARFSGWWGG